ncbi:unnamed protein product [Protopolystoma xenopodis]|uniref:Uncharacterized protein n=1 Tax=Protopolystoma xenopodis TaxID=117903 RepID=A0A3S5BQB6_9PLAT|nr:unnamed protein product [Protopolystoma xenopodis]
MSVESRPSRARDKGHVTLRWYSHPDGMPTARVNPYARVPREGIKRPDLQHTCLLLFLRLRPHVLHRSACAK